MHVDRVTLASSGLQRTSKLLRFAEGYLSHKIPTLCHLYVSGSFWTTVETWWRDMATPI